MNKVKELLKNVLRKIVVKIGVFCIQFHDDFSKELMPTFANEPKNLILKYPFDINRPERITIGDDVKLGPHCYFSLITKFSEEKAPTQEQRDRKQTFDPSIKIGDRVRTRGGLQIGAMDYVEIGNDVIIAYNVFISDGFHGNETAEEPYRYQPMTNIAPVIIEDGCWIGQNAVIMPGVTIGKNSIVGANSVVTKSIPAQSVAAGVPAKVIKKWDSENSNWFRV